MATASTEKVWRLDGHPEVAVSVGVEDDNWGPESSFSIRHARGGEISLPRIVIAELRDVLLDAYHTR